MRTISVVLKPGTRSIRITSPPSLSTSSWPTTCSRLVVAAFGQHLGAHAAEQLQRRVLIEHDHEIDRLERGEHLGARMHLLHRPPVALQALDRRIAVETDDEPVAGGTRLRQELDVAGMQEIEAAVGEADAQARPAPFGEPLVEHRPVEDDLLLGRERGGGKNAVAQLGGRDRRGAALADHHGGGGVGRAHRRLEAGIGREHGGQHRDHGIAGARHVAHLDRIGGDVDRLAVRRHERHAGFAARHQHGFAADRAVELGRGRGDVGFARDGMAGHLGKLMPVRSDQGRTLVAGKILAFGIDDHRLAELPGGFDQGPDDARREQALGIIGQHHARRARQRRQRLGEHGLFGLAIDRRRQLPVGAQQMGRMVLGDEADLARGHARAIDDQMGFDQRLGAELRRERAPGIVVAHHADEDAAGAERGNVARHVAGAAHDQLAPGHRQDRCRRFGRDARDLAIDEVVEHQISDAEHGLLGHELERFLEIEHGARRRYRYRSG